MLFSQIFPVLCHHHKSFQHKPIQIKAIGAYKMSAEMKLLKNLQNKSAIRPEEGKDQECIRYTLLFREVSLSHSP